MNRRLVSGMTRALFDSDLIASRLALAFSIKYLWWLARYGYWNNPYEVEARAAEVKK